MAAKSIINELYQRLRTAAPIYSTRADDADGFLCTLTLPAVECEFEALSAADRSFTGKGCSKKEAEHAAAIAAVELLTAESVLRPDWPAGSHSRGTSAASPSVSSATSGVSLPGVGSKRSKSNADPLDDDTSAESLEARILDALTAVYPKPLNGAQLAKLCGHFKLKSKVNHLLYMKLKAQGLVELLDTPTPAWRAAGKTLPAAFPPADAAAGAEQQRRSAPAGTAAAAADAAAAALSSDEGALQAGAAVQVGQDRARSLGGCAGGGPDGSSAVLTSSRTSDALAGNEQGGEVSSGAGRARPTPPPPTAAAAAAVATARPGTHNSSAGRTAAAAAAAASQQAGSRPVGSSRVKKEASPAVSGSPGLGSRQALSGCGLRGSCSPVPPAVHSRRQQPPEQQQQQLRGLHAGLLYGSSNRGAVPTAGQSDIARYRRQHIYQPQQYLQQQQQQGVRGAAEGLTPLQQQQQQQRWQQQLQREQGWHADGSTQPAGMEALLLPQTLAAVAGLGLLDPSDAALLFPGAAAAAAATTAGAGAGSGLRLSSPRQSPGVFVPTSAAQQAYSTGSFGRSHSHCSQEQHSHRLSPGFGATAAAAAAAATAAAAAGDRPSGGTQLPAGGGAVTYTGAAAAAAAQVRSGLQQCRQGTAGSDSDEEISPAVLAAASEAASLEPAPFDADRVSGSTGSFQQQQQQQQAWEQRAALQSQQQSQQQHLQPVDLLAAMHINEHPATQQQQQQQQPYDGPCAQDAVVPHSSMRGPGGGGLGGGISSSRAPGEATGTKRKYPAYLSTEQAGEGGAGAADDAAAAAAAAAGGTADGAAAGMHVTAGLEHMQGGGVEEQQAQVQAQQQQWRLHEGQDGQSQAPSQQQQQEPVPDLDQVHPQRRRRRSGQGEGFSGRGLRPSSATAAAAAAGGLNCMLDAVAASRRGRGSSPAAEDEQTGSSDDMQDLQEVVQGRPDVPAAAAAAAGGAAALSSGGLPAAREQQEEHIRHQQQLHAAGRQQQQAWTGSGVWQQQQQQQHARGGVTPGQPPVSSAADMPACWSKGQGNLVAAGSPWADQAAGSSGNPWQWHGGGHQGRQQFPGAVAADSEGNGSCLSWPAAAAAHGQTQQQVRHVQGGHAGLYQQQQPGVSWGLEGGPPASPCMSGLSVGASAVSGGNRGASVEPLQAGTLAAAAAAATGQEVTQPAPAAAAVARRQHSTSDQQQQQPVDWLQSEEQALQLLSRLALPPAGCLPQRVPGPTEGHGFAAGARAAQHQPAAVQPREASTAAGTSAAAAGGCLTVAMAAAAAAAQAAAAVASAAGLVTADPPAVVVGAEQQQQQVAAHAADSPSVVDTAAGTGSAAAATAAAGKMGESGSSSIAPAELAAEYERRVGAVRDLVQQLNEALQGLSSFQGQLPPPSR